MIVWQAPGFSKAQHRREVAAERATYKRVSTRIAPKDFARLEALCERPEGCARPSRASVLWWVVLLGISRAEKINASATKHRVRLEARRAARKGGSRADRGDPAGMGGAGGSVY